MAMNKILVAVDFSDRAELAYRSALGLARRFGSEIVAVHVSEVPSWPRGLDVPMRRAGGEMRRRVDERVEADERRLRDFQRRFEDRDVPVSRVVKDGHPAWGIVEAASEHAPDLVVVGSRGLSPIQRLLLGSVAARVARLVQAPVLVVRPPGDASGAFHRVLVATDFSGPSIRALDLAHTVASKGAIVDLVNFWRIPGTQSWEVDSEGGADDGSDPWGVAVHEQVQAAGVEWMEKLPQMDKRASFRLVNQEPVEGIHDWTDQHDCDLVVIGSHGHDQHHDPVLGSVTRATLRRVSCSVLIAR